jgi:hypothetical protein
MAQESGEVSVSESLNFEGTGLLPAAWHPDRFAKVDSLHLAVQRLREQRTPCRHGMHDPVLKLGYMSTR